MNYKQHGFVSLVFTLLIMFEFYLYTDIIKHPYMIFLLSCLTMGAVYNFIKMFEKY